MIPQNPIIVKTNVYAYREWRLPNILFLIYLFFFTILYIIYDSPSCNFQFRDLLIDMIFIDYMYRRKAASGRPHFLSCWGCYLNSKVKFKYNILVVRFRCQDIQKEKKNLNVTFHYQSGYLATFLVYPLAVGVNIEIVTLMDLCLMTADGWIFTTTAR